MTNNPCPAEVWTALEETLQRSADSAAAAVQRQRSAENALMLMQRDLEIARRVGSEAIYRTALHRLQRLHALGVDVSVAVSRLRSEIWPASARMGATREHIDDETFSLLASHHNFQKWRACVVNSSHLLEKP